MHGKFKANGTRNKKTNLGKKRINLARKLAKMLEKQNQPKWRKFGLLQAIQKNSAKNKSKRKSNPKPPKRSFKICKNLARNLKLKYQLNFNSIFFLKYSSRLYKSLKN